MKKRLISLLLAFSMMLTFLPAGAVSAFAEGAVGPIDPSKGTLLTGGETITDSGPYQLQGSYTKAITIDTEGSVEINVTGDVTGNLPHTRGNDPLIIINNGTVAFNGNDSYTVTNNQVIRNNGGILTVRGGKYVCMAHPYEYDGCCFSLGHGKNLIENVTIETSYQAIVLGWDGENAVIKNSKIKKINGRDDSGAIYCRPTETNGIMELDNVEVEAENGSALRVETGTITINGGKYSSKQGAAIATRANSGSDLDLTMNGGTYQSDSYDYAVANFGCYVTSSGRKCNIKINGSKFIGGQLLWFHGAGAETLTIDENTIFQSTGGTHDAVIVSYGKLIFNSGTIEVSGGSERAALRTFERGEAIVNDGTFKGAKYDIYEQYDDGYSVSSPCRVQLKNATFDDNVCNVYLQANRQIDVDPAYTGQVSIECADPSDGRQLTKATAPKGQEKLNLTSANAGYLVGYKTEDGQEYRCLSKTVGVTVSDPEGEVKAGDPAKFTVSLDHAGSTGTGILTFGDKNGEIEYLDDNDKYQSMPKDGLPINLASDKNDYAFRITPKNAGEQTLTAAVVRDDVKLGTADKDYTVAGRVHTTVTIEGLEDAVIKEGESKDFTVKVDPKDDTGKGKIDFGGKNGEVQYKDGDDWKDMPADGLEIDLDDGAKDYEFRIAPKETGKQTLTVAVKQGENKLARDEKDFVVSEMPILTLKDGVITSVTVPGKNGADPEDITEIVKKNANEDGSFHVPEGATVSVAFDKDAFADSGLKFGHWDITGLDDPNAYQNKESFAFEMPAKGVTLKAMTQDASIEDDGPGVLGTVAIIGTAAVGGAVLGYQAYSLGAEFAGKLMALPYFPSNRSALAMMLWEDAGKPMPESELLYPDVGQEERDMDLQHAARWAMENELIPDLNDEGTAPEEMKFYPDNTVSKIDVLNAWQKAQELKQNA